MTTREFYQQFDSKIPIIQQFANELASDFDKARYLYHETAHQALKHRTVLNKESFEEWLITTMKHIYKKVIN